MIHAVNLVNQVVTYISDERVAATAREMMALITLAVVDDRVFNQLF